MRNIRNFLGLTLNYFIDYVLFVKDSGILRKNTEIKLLAFITFTYHTLEKGFSMSHLRLGFGKEKVDTLLKSVLLYIEKNYDVTKSQFIAACSVLKKYYDLHIDNNYNINDYFNNDNFLLINKYALPDLGGAIRLNKETYFPIERIGFSIFVLSRHSIRNFSSEKVDLNKIKSAIDLANHCPSACNRQSSKVYLINRQNDVDDILQIQKGVLATAQEIHQLLIVTSNRNYFFTSGERNQLFVDGGIFLESLLLSLHSEGIGSCTLHWSLNSSHDKAMESIVGLSKGEKVIALLAIGYVSEDFKVPYSHRKSVDELLVVND